MSTTKNSAMPSCFALTRYCLLFVGALLHIASNELHMLHATHLEYHLNNVPHRTLAGSNFFCFAYVVAIALHLVHDAYAFAYRVAYRYVVGAVFVVLPILSVISYGQYVGWYYYEAPLSVVAAVSVLVASIMLLAHDYTAKRAERRQYTTVM